MARVDGVNQVLDKKDKYCIPLITANVIDDFLIAGWKADINDLLEEMKRELEVGKIAIGRELIF